MFLRKVTPGSGSRLSIVDHNESYGRYILKNVVRNIEINECVDLGCGGGYDLSVVKASHPNAELCGIDIGNGNRERLDQNGIELITLNIERDQLPFPSNSVDFIIANQVFEHTKEIFWINHEIFRCLRIGGKLFIGVPNILSAHNRILGLFGIHPTQFKAISAHVRPFSHRDLLNFYSVIAGSFSFVDHFWGAQFYPFPGGIARILARTFPSLAFSIFFLITKKAQYENQFLEHPKNANLETNFFLGTIEH